MPGSLKTDAIVLRSIRYSEADRVLHLYTPDYGRLAAIAKGVRRARSRFGGRLEPFFSLRLVLYEGRGDLLTVTSAQTVAPHARLREHGATLDAAGRACDAVARLFATGDANPAVFHLLAHELELLDSDPLGAGHSNQLAFRLKLLVAAGFGPHLATCAGCGEADNLCAFSGAAGGVVCGACEGAAFPLGEDAHSFMVQALGRPLAQAPEASEQALRQAERAISDTVEHHAGLRLRSASPGRTVNTIARA
ncbi:MAG TPA: DNA repair protein RecO [Solirubrobacteraceae bacterium]|nr:DNA repair protein RecO [Solirubrobacteraceae bacterium]